MERDRRTAFLVSLFAALSRSQAARVQIHVLAGLHTTSSVWFLVWEGTLMAGEQIPEIRQGKTTCRIHLIIGA
jgi:hypothetical protein